VAFPVRRPSRLLFYDSPPAFPFIFCGPSSLSTGSLIAVFCWDEEARSVVSRGLVSDPPSYLLCSISSIVLSPPLFVRDICPRLSRIQEFLHALKLSFRGVRIFLVKFLFSRMDPFPRKGQSLSWWLPAVVLNVSLSTRCPHSRVSSSIVSLPFLDQIDCAEQIVSTHAVRGL